MKRIVIYYTEEEYAVIAQYLEKIKCKDIAEMLRKAFKFSKRTRGRPKKDTDTATS